MIRRIVFTAILAAMMLAPWGSARTEEVHVKIHVGDIDITETYVSDDTVYYAWMFRAWTNDFSMPHERLAIDTVYAIRLYDEAGGLISSTDGTFTFTPDDLTILRDDGDSIYGRYERTIFGEGAIDRALWERFVGWEVVVGASDFR